MKIQNLLSFPVFWINSALLIYFSGSIFISIFFELLGRLSEGTAIISYMFHNILGLAKNVLIGWAFIVSERNNNWDSQLDS